MLLPTSKQRPAAHCLYHRTCCLHCPLSEASAAQSTVVCSTRETRTRTHPLQAAAADAPNPNHPLKNGTWAVRRQPDGAVALVAGPRRAAAAAAAAAVGLAVITAHEELHHVVPDGAVRVGRPCAGSVHQQPMTGLRQKVQPPTIGLCLFWKIFGCASVQHALALLTQQKRCCVQYRNHYLAYALSRTPGS